MPSSNSIRPVVYGYLRTHAHGDAAQVEVDWLTAELRGYAEREGLELGAVFTDEDERAPTRGDRPGFAALLEALGADEATGVVVPGRHHLSWHPSVQAQRAAQIEELGVRLYVVRPDPTLHTANGHEVRRARP